MYQEYKCMLWTACFILSIPLSFRAILDFTDAFNVKFQNFTSNHQLTYNVTFDMLTNYIPIFF